MGFGILFIGYIFLLNLSFFGYTDVLAGVLILYALEKLKRWNRGFRYAFFATIPFAAIGLFEFILKIGASFSSSLSPTLMMIAEAIRMAALCPMHVCLLLGFKEITAEVGLQKMESRAMMLIPLSPLVHLLGGLLKIDPLFSAVDPGTLLSIRFVLLIGTLIYTLGIAIFIYRCYARICLPGDVDMKERPSRFKFINDYRARKEQKQKAEIEARIEEMRKKNQNKKKKKKR